MRCVAEERESSRWVRPGRELLAYAEFPFIYRFAELEELSDSTVLLERGEVERN